MKGFPNQVADLGKLSAGLEVLATLVGRGANVRDDGVFGRALVEAGVAGTGHVPMAVKDYIRIQLRKPIGGQSFRTTARGLRELFRLLGFIDDAEAIVRISPLGMQGAKFAGLRLDARQIDFWRGAISAMSHLDADGLSHPYQVLLRLVAKSPGITRAKCALALEAHNDTPEELDRIVALADLTEGEIKRSTRVSDSTWDNAKKILPRFAEQLGDVIKAGQNYTIADAPGNSGEAPPTAPSPSSKGARAPRTSREVTSDEIGRAGLAERDEPLPPPDIDPAELQNSIALRADRLRRHNLLVRDVAAKLEGAGAKLFEDPFDILALFMEVAILVEVKSLDGTKADERDRVRGALAQLLYYEAFVTVPVAGASAIKKIACFELKPSDEHAL